MPSTLMPVGKSSIQEIRRDIEDLVRQVICRTRTSFDGHERRRCLRVPFPYPIYLTPVDATGEVEHEKSFSVVGRQLSERGLDFYHNEPLTSRKLIASLAGEDDRMISLVLELTWCRFGRHGLYENGGRFVSIARSPLCNSLGIN